MYGIERDYCDAAIGAVISANRALMETLVEEAVSKSYVLHKGDTLGLDQVPENAISSEILAFDPYSVLITEERGKDANPLAEQSEFAVQGPRTFFVCDPCDRSSQFCEFLKKNRKGAERVMDVLKKDVAQSFWHKRYGKHCDVSGANIAITCVRRGLPICSVLLNLITQEMTVACSAGIFKIPVDQKSDDAPKLATIDRMQMLTFPNMVRRREKFFTTFMGKPERGYPKNFAMTNLAQAGDIENHLYYNLPGGPTRILYLSTRQPSTEAVGFIVANGEKIGEWIHWIPFVRFAIREDDQGAKALHLFEVMQDESELRDGYLMTPTEAYSIFKKTSTGQVIVDVDRLGKFDNPSKYRATLLVAPATNDWAIRRAQQYGYRQLIFHGD